MAQEGGNGFYLWLSFWVGPVDSAWTLAEHTVVTAHNQEFNQVVVVSPNQERRTLYFSVR